MECVKNVTVHEHLEQEYYVEDKPFYGFAIIEIEESVDNYESITLTVTGYNTTTLIENITVGEACRGLVSGDTNGDSLVNVTDIVIMSIPTNLIESTRR